MNQHDPQNGGGSAIESAEVFAVEVDGLRAIQSAEIDTMISTAKAYPRDLARFTRGAAQMACRSEETAISCFYRLGRGANAIEGPSIRFAEILAATFGNFRVAHRLVTVAREYVVVEGIAIDLESNFAYRTEVTGQIVYGAGNRKAGQRYPADQIRVTIQATAAKAERNAITKAIPRAVWEPILDEAREVAKGKADDLPIRRQKMIGAFTLYGISEEMLLARVEVKDRNQLTTDHIVDLRTVYQAIHRGEIAPEEAFPPIEEAQAPAPAASGTSAASAPRAAQDPGNAPQAPDEEERSTLIRTYTLARMRGDPDEVMEKLGDDAARQPAGMSNDELRAAISKLEAPPLEGDGPSAEELDQAGEGGGANA